MSKWEPRCPYVQNAKSSVFCTSFVSKPEECETCGWNPEEHARRVAKLRSGEVKTYLKIDLHKVGTIYNNMYR